MANPLGLVTGIENVAQTNNAYVAATWPANPAQDNVVAYEVRWFKTTGDASGTATAVDATHLSDTSQTWGVSVYAGYFVLMGGAYGKVLDNTSSQLTISAWTDVNGNTVATPALGTYTLIHYSSQVAYSTSTKVTGLAQATGYTFNIRAINTLGASSPWSSDRAITTARKSTPPSTPGVPQITQSPRGAFVTWTPITDLDLQGYHLQFQLSGGAWTDFSPSGGLLFATAASYIAPPGTLSGATINFRVRAEDWSGNFSGYATGAGSTIALVGAADFTGSIGGSNLFPNSAFLDDSSQPGVIANGWSPYNNGPEAMTTSVQASGGYVAAKFQRVTWTVTNTSQKGILLTSGSPWKPNTTYMVSYYAKSPDAALAGAQLALNWNIGPAVTVAVSNPGLSSSWQRYVWRITWGASVDPQFFTSYQGAAIGNLDFSGIQAEQGDVVTAWAPLTNEVLTGAIGLGNLSAIAPATPTGLASTTGTDASAQVNNVYVNVTWTANAASDKVAAYEVRYRKSGDSIYYYLTTGSTSLKIPSLISGQPYQIAIRAQNTLGNYSAYTAEISQTANPSSMPATPGTVTATGFPRGIALSWPANTEADLQGYQVQVSSVNPSPGPAVWTTVMTTALQTAFLYQAPAGTAVGTSFWFQVRALNWANQPSGYSGPATASTLAVTNSDIVANSIIVDKLAAGNLSVIATITAGGKIIVGNPPGAAGLQIDTTGIKAYNSGGVNTVAINSDGSASFLGSITSGSTIAGAAITGGTVSIGTSPNWFNADASGIWLGGASFGASPFRVSMAGVVTASNIVAQVQPGSSLPTGIVGASQIVAGAITTDKLTVGSVGDSIVLNGGFEDLDGSSYPTSWQAPAIVGSATGGSDAGTSFSGSKSYKLHAIAGAGNYVSITAAAAASIPVSAGDWYYGSVQAKASVAGMSALYFRFLWGSTPGGQELSYSDIAGAQSPSTTTFTKYEGLLQAPAGAKYLTAQFYNFQPASVGDIWIDDVQIRRAVGTANILSASITSAQIITLVADKITTGNLTATVAITSGIIQTNSSGARFQIDSASIKAYDGGATDYGGGVGITAKIGSDGSVFLKGIIAASGFKGSYFFGTSADTNVPALPSPSVANLVGSFMLDPGNGLRFWVGNGTVANPTVVITPAGAITIYSGANFTVTGGSIYAGTVATASTIGAAGNTAAGYKITGSEIDLYNHDAAGVFTTSPLNFWTDSGGTWKRKGVVTVQAGGGSTPALALQSLNDLNITAGVAIDGQTAQYGVVYLGSNLAAGKVVPLVRLAPDSTVGHNVPVELYSTILGADAASIVIDPALSASSVYAQYKTIEIRIWALLSVAGDIGLRMNSDTASNYDYLGMESNGAVSSNAFTNTTYFRCGYHNAGTFPSASVVQLFNAADGGHHEIPLFSQNSRVDAEAAMVLTMLAGKWRGTSFITTMTLMNSGGGNFKAGTMVTVTGYSSS